MPADAMPVGTPGATMPVRQYASTRIDHGIGIAPQPASIGSAFDATCPIAAAPPTPRRPA